MPSKTQTAGGFTLTGKRAEQMLRARKAEALRMLSAVSDCLNVLHDLRQEAPDDAELAQEFRALLFYQAVPLATYIAVNHWGPE